MSELIQETIRIPKVIYEKIKQLNIDLNTLVVELLIKELNLSSTEEIQIRLQLAQKHFEEAKKYLTENNPVQASEKLYKCAVECIKALAMKYRVPEVEEYRREGGWWTKLLSRAAKRLATTLGSEIICTAWSIAYDLHIWRFHRASLEVCRVRSCVKYIEQLLKETLRRIEIHNAQ